MKRTMLIIMLASCAIAFLSAQGYNDGQGQDQRPGQDQGSRQRRNPEGQQLQRGPESQPRRDAAPRQRGGNEWPTRLQPESVSVSGNLAIVRGMIAVTDGGTVYIVDGLHRFVGFIDGLSEGAAVTLEGNAFPGLRDDTVKFLSVQKMTLNGKDYDLARPVSNFQNQWPHPMPQQMRHHQHHQMPRHAPQKMHGR
ncbi:MAG: hypothetical protein FWG46_06570 [Treponema sp.]|nr:hypothetical protein [Treponema sp.]